MKQKMLMVYLLLSILPAHADKMDSLFNALDQSIAKKSYYFEIKDKQLLELKQKFHGSSIAEDKFLLARKLMDEFGYYKSDSALYYSDVCMSIAKQLDNENYILETRLKQAYLLSFPRLFHESRMILESIDVEALSLPHQITYYYAFIYVIHNQMRDQDDSPYAGIYRQQILSCMDSFLAIADKTSFEYLNILAYQYYLHGEYNKAVDVVTQILNRGDLSPYARSEALFHLGGIYMSAEGYDISDVQQQIIRSAMLSNEYAITKNPPLLYLATLLMKEDRNVDRAYDYINIAVEDAQKFSRQHKSVIVERTFNTIQSLYVKKIDKQRHKLEVFLTVVFFLCFVIFIVLCILLYNNNTLKRTRKALSTANCKLRDANRIKESYISHFLNQYSSHIEKVENYKKHIIRQLNVQQPREMVKQEALSSISIKDDLENLFLAFDKSILDLYPDFIEKVNRLLHPDQRYIIKNSDNGTQQKLNTELRILALLRLGINENKQIASFFRFTVQTVYNYRSKARSRAIDEATFEEEIMKIGSY